MERAVGKMRVRGKDYPVKITVFERSGSVPSATFTIEGLASNKYGHAVTSQTWEGLYKNAMLASKRASVKIAIPFMERDYRTGRPPFRSGTIVGKHLGNDNFLIKYDDDPRGEARQDTMMHSTFDEDSRFFRVMNKERQAEYLAMTRERDRLEKAVRKFHETYCFDPTDEIEVEIEKVASEEERD